MKILSVYSLIFVSALLLLAQEAHAFSIVFMGARRGRKGGLKRDLDDEQPSKRRAGQPPVPNGGKGQEITGVSLPEDGKMKGWEFGGGTLLACAKIHNELFAVQGDCPRCAFDLYKGDLIIDDAGWEDLPRIACPTCATTYSLRDGTYGPPIKRTGLSAFVGGLAKTATQNEAYRDAKAFKITQDEDGRIFCADR